MSRLFGAAVAVAALIDGGFVGLCDVALHQQWWGLVLGWLGTLGVCWVIGPGWTTRVPYALGCVAVVWRAMTPRATTGSFAVASDAPGYALLALGLALVLLASATLPLRRGVTKSPRGVTLSRRGVTKSR